MSRVQRRRGVALPAGTKYVGRPTRWGNPFRIGDEWERWEDAGFYPTPDGPTMDRRIVVARYRFEFLPARLRENPDFLEPLRGCVLACWCPVVLGVPCHADIILEWFESHPTLATAGERPVLGLHRQPAPNADTAPAWFPDTDAKREARFRRWVKGAQP